MTVNFRAVWLIINGYLTSFCLYDLRKRKHHQSSLVANLLYKNYSNLSGIFSLAEGINYHYTVATYWWITYTSKRTRPMTSLSCMKLLISYVFFFSSPGDSNPITAGLASPTKDAHQSETSAASPSQSQPSVGSPSKSHVVSRERPSPIAMETSTNQSEAGVQCDGIQSRVIRPRPPITSPAPRHVTNTELAVLQQCLKRWRNEVESDVKGDHWFSGNFLSKHTGFNEKINKKSCSIFTIIIHQSGNTLLNIFRIHPEGVTYSGPQNTPESQLVEEPEIHDSDFLIFCRAARQHQRTGRRYWTDVQRPGYEEGKKFSQFCSKWVQNLSAVFLHSWWYHNMSYIVNS